MTQQALARPKSLVFLLALAMLAGACPNESPPSRPPAPPPADGGQAGDTPQPGPDDHDAEVVGPSDFGPPPAPDSAPPATCAEIRNCIVRCLDADCKRRCVTGAPAPARAAHEAIEACSARGCPDGDEVCKCQQQCLDGGDCLELVDACRGDEDLFCDMICH